MPKRWLSALIVLLILGAFALLTYRMLQIPRELARAAIRKEEKSIDVGAIVTQVRELNRLETESMRVMHVSTTNQSFGMIPDSLGGDSITLMAVGDVIAGLDLSLLKAEDVRLDSDGVLDVRLPTAQILVTRVDNEQTRVIKRSTGWFRKGDVDLESHARAFAEQGIRHEAMLKGILPLAQKNGEQRVAELLHKMGAQKIRFTESAPPRARG
ncbi:MAG TPA: DUF4230 domain-containing protein [Thermoanaerobaculia bacterium]|nr:DUF4230 domain-containing protein [Thermoanaerobaculia bacterium]